MVPNAKHLEPFLFPAFMIFKLETAFHAPALFFVFRMGLLLSNGNTVLIIRSSEVQASAPAAQLRLPICGDTLD